MFRAYRWNERTIRKRKEGLEDCLRRSRGEARFEACDHLSAEQLHSPFLMSGMKKAAHRIMKAIENNEKICVFGDYDVDGICSVSILFRYFRSIGRTVGTYIPDRVSEGYGLNVGAITKLAEEGVTLIITVDCGITSVDAVEKANVHGIDVIITDHHLPPQELPDAFVLINPNLEQCEYPFKKLCGAGIALKLVTALHGEPSELLPYLLLAAVATVADIVDLEDENWIIVRLALEAMRKREIPILGLRELINVIPLDYEQLSSYHIAFQIAPRLNAAGRIGDASSAMRLMTTQDASIARKISEELNHWNVQRQEVEQEILELAEQQLGEVSSDERVLIVSGQDWNEGVIGIVASKLKEKYYRPTIVISINESIGKASARSIPGFSIIDALNRKPDLLLQYGGHEQAAGFSIPEENINALKQSLEAYAETTMANSDWTEELTYEFKIREEDITTDAIQMIRKLEPFGKGNPKPKFLLENQNIRNIRRIGRTKLHLAGELKGGTRLIGFQKEHHFEVISRNSIDLIVGLSLNRFQGKEEKQVEVSDIKIHPYFHWMDAIQLIQMLTERSDITSISHFLKEQYEKQEKSDGASILHVYATPWGKQKATRAGASSEGEMIQHIESTVNIVKLTKKVYNRFICWDVHSKIHLDRYRDITNMSLVASDFSSLDPNLEKKMLLSCIPDRDQFVFWYQLLKEKKQLSLLAEDWGDSVISIVILLLVFYDQGMIAMKLSDANRLEVTLIHESPSSFLLEEHVILEALKHSLCIEK